MMTRRDIRRLSQETFSAALLAVLLSGCQSGMAYRAGDLPTEFAARPVFNGKRIDLNQLGNATTGSALIQEQDELSVAVSSGDFDLEKETKAAQLLVSEHGKVNVPYVGFVQVVGMTPSQAGEVIRQASIQRQMYVAPSVAVQISKKHMRRITVAGAVAKPGQHEIRPGASTLATALLAAGGLTDDASSRITVYTPSVVDPQASDANGDSSVILQANGESNRNGLASGNVVRRRPQVTQISLVAPDAARSESWQNLPDGTVITVHEQPERYVTVMGLTGNRTIELPYDREYRMLDALAEGGGPRFSPWISNKLKVLRPHPETGEIISIRANLGEAKRNRDANIPLGPGDVFLVEETPLTFILSTVGQLLGVGLTAARATVIP